MTSLDPGTTLIDVEAIVEGYVRVHPIAAEFGNLEAI